VGSGTKAEFGGRVKDCDLAGKVPTHFTSTATAGFNQKATFCKSLVLRVSSILRADTWSKCVTFAPKSS
jgi:hypothetical protein